MGDDARLALVKSKLEADLSAVDFQWSLLWSALSSYRHDTVLRPFPPMFASEDTDFKDYNGVEKSMSKCPSLLKLKAYLQRCEQSAQTPKLDTKLTQLLHWLVQPKNFRLKTCDKDKYSVITELIGQVIPVASPSHVFEVIYNEAMDEKFRERQGDKDTLFAIHGSRVENFHSILNHGLKGHMSKMIDSLKVCRELQFNKRKNTFFDVIERGVKSIKRFANQLLENALFGEGTYLSGELSVSMPYAPTGAGWDHSVLGDRLSCFAVCQIIDDDKYVKCSEKAAVEPSSSNGAAGTTVPRTSSRSRIAGSEGGDIPEKYYVVRNNDVIRVKYILVYAEKSKSKHPSTTWSLWLKEHKFLIMLCFYALILVCVGLYNSPTFHYHIRRYLRQR